MRVKIFAIILNFNSRECIIPCLRSLDKSKVKNLKTIVVDNASTDGSIEEVERRYRSIRVLRNKENLGFAGGNNVGLKYALEKGADYVFLLNPDAVVKENTIEALLKVLGSGEKIGIVGSKIYDKGGRIWSCGGEVDQKRFTGRLIGLGGRDHGQYNEEKEVDFVSGTAMLIKREVFKEVGFFTEDYFLYYEDVDFCLRTRRLGFKIGFAPASIVYHDWSSIVGKNSPQKEYYMARNHFLFLERNGPFMVKIREFLRLPKTLYEHYLKGEKFALLGIKDYFFRRLGEHDYWN